jgi:alpha-glucan phosphorylase-like protein
MHHAHQLDVAYFSMEIGLSERLPTFAGGLGMLAADLMRSCADLGTSAACVTVRWRHGYQSQTVNPDGTVAHAEYDWDPAAEGLAPLPEHVVVHVEGRAVHVGAWRLDIVGIKGTVPVYFLDTDLPVNRPEDRDITRNLYGGDQAMRIKQEIVLGIGGVRMLRALGIADVGTYHMNEGHCAFLTLELLKERGFSDDAVRPSCAFTTHTPVAAGHDVFPYDLAGKLVGDMLPWHIRKLAGEDALSMTLLAMNLSHYTCGVSALHGGVARAMLGNPAIDAITNGIHHPTWASPEMATLFDAHFPGWRGNPALLAHAHALPDDDVLAAHAAAKARLIDAIRERTGRSLDPSKLIAVEARRIVPYKQHELLYADENRLRQVGGGMLQIVHSGNTFPGDSFAGGVVAHLRDIGGRFGDALPVVYVPHYDPAFAKLLVAGADVWLNTPVRLKEASGTSGMKAALNGTVNVSTLDGWWAEAYAQDPESGWRIGPEREIAGEDEMRKLDAEDLYTQLELEILPSFADGTRWAGRMKRAIALVAVFNTHRCIREYCERAWGL